jgi:hypothetical protein
MTKRAGSVRPLANVVAQGLPLLQLVTAQHLHWFRPMWQNWAGVRPDA